MAQKDWGGASINQVSQGHNLSFVRTLILYQLSLLEFLSLFKYKVVQPHVCL